MFKKIYKKAKSFEHSEYMTWYVMNNKSHFKINLVRPKPVCKELSNDIRLQTRFSFFQ